MKLDILFFGITQNISCYTKKAAGAVFQIKLSQEKRQNSCHVSDLI